MPIAYISHPECALHDMGPHPEQPARLSAIEQRLIDSGLDQHLQHHLAPEVDQALLALAHDPTYLAQLRRMAPDTGLVQLDPDTSMNPHSLSAALHAAGASQLAVDLVMQGKTKQAFCAVRPPGHHAERGRAMGFCLLNNIALAAYHALHNHGLKRVAIVDFDVHHGNGTEDIVQGDERILFCSTFQHPFYPHSGSKPSAGNVINSPLAAGSDSKDFRSAVERDWLPALEDFKPELLLVSAGFDAHQEDEMANLNLVDEDFAWVSRKILHQAERSAAGRVVSSLEGGYHLEALARSVEAHLRAFLSDA